MSPLPLLGFSKKFTSTCVHKIRIKSMFTLNHLLQDLQAVHATLYILLTTLSSLQKKTFFTKCQQHKKKKELTKTYMHARIGYTEAMVVLKRCPLAYRSHDIVSCPSYIRYKAIKCPDDDSKKMSHKCAGNWNKKTRILIKQQRTG